MPTIEEAIDIAASPEVVTAVLLDVDAAPLWTSGLERFELIEGVVGEPGSVGHAHYLEGSRRYVVEDRLLEATPGHHFRSKIRGGGLSATVDTRLTTIPAGTRVTIRWQGTGANPVSKIVLPFLGRKVRARMREDMRALRDLVETRATTDHASDGT